MLPLSYYHLVANYFNPATLADDILSLRLLGPTSAITILACQGFYARRVFLVDRRHRFIVIGAIVLLAVETGFAILVSVEAFRGSQWTVSVYYGLDMTIDFTLAGTLVAFLLRNRTGAERTDSMIQTLVVYTINTGLVTSIVGMVAFVFALIKPGNLVYFAMGIIVTKLYANSVLALLNTRRYLSSLSQAIDAIDAQSTLVFNHAVCLHCNSVRGWGPQVVSSIPSSGESRTGAWSHTDFHENFQMQNPPHDRRKRAHAQRDDVSEA
ncbi:hypothetical protein GSI_05424 [Ganoderma sinense ZZ0214-1]|uniref:DUF6534 domain-containing protein n=1 Tax=Ganoderma sinense ZZ0214-1 TaxID=1077348 RepID=A0A2G8SEJ2_9APHY|nr:hypothetical protein GSI_05424 [Ganoderma sinense ZZ0214-1]